MPASDYTTGGLYWAQVQHVMAAASCSRLRAVSALKSCGNDTAAATASIQNAQELNITSRAAIPTPTLGPARPTEEKSVRSPFDDPPPTYAELPGAPVAPALNRVVVDADKFTLDDDPLDFSKLHLTSRTFVHSPRPPTVAVDELRPTPSISPSPAPTPTPTPAPAPAPAPAPLPYQTPPAASEPWDLRLPTIALDPTEEDFSVEEGRSTSFSPPRLLSVLQHGMQPSRLQHYLSFFSAAAVRARINTPVCGYPPIFYVVATNDDKLVRAWVGGGGDVNAVEPHRGIPVLAFAIMLPALTGVDTTHVVVTLLSLGADASVIPRVFFSPHVEDPVDKLPLDGKEYTEFAEDKKRWCAEWMRPVLASTATLTKRYYLDKTTREKGPTDRQLQVAQTHRATALLGVSFFLIGQTSATRSVTQKLLTHMAMPRSKPLVMVFAGPSGHGKTELARRMGDLLTLEMECVDCTEMKHETDLFGPKKPYLGYQAGSPVNNFLARNSGKRCIVFLDEFEKTTREVQNALLIPFDEGRYLDRRSQGAVDCSQTIWIIATNAVDDIILDYCESHSEIFNAEDQIQQNNLVAELAIRMKKRLKTEFGNPLSGRISSIIPFLPFSPGEAAVVAHKYILELQRKVKDSVRLSGKQLVGGIMLEVRRDGAVCCHLAENGYDSDQGARSLHATVASSIEDELVQAYLDENGRIQDGQPLVRYVVDLAQNGVLSVFKATD